MWMFVPQDVSYRSILCRSRISYVPVKSKLQHSPQPPSPPGISWAFDTFSCLGGREFDELSHLGVGHLITTHRGWGI